MFTSSRIVLKHHRFEVGAAAVLGLLAGIAALVISYRLSAIGVPAGCFERWLAGGGAEGAGACAGPVQAFAEINEDEAGKLLAGMAVLPFIVGLLSGVSIVGRELETGTAQTGWSLTPSRRRWLIRHVGPILVVLVGSTAVAAGAASVLEATREPWYHSTFGDLSLHGWPVIGRALAAFSVGLFVGAVVGRSLPALVLGGIVCLVLLLFEGSAQAAWHQANLEPVGDTNIGGVSADSLSGWVDPDGHIASEEMAFQQVPAGVRDAGQWLIDRGWRLVQLGVPETKAGQLVALDTVGFLGVAVVVGLATVPIVDRRRPL